MFARFPRDTREWTYSGIFNYLSRIDIIRGRFAAKCNVQINKISTASAFLIITGDRKYFADHDLLEIRGNSFSDSGGDLTNKLMRKEAESKTTTHLKNQETKDMYVYKKERNGCLDYSCRQFCGSLSFFAKASELT